MELLGASCTPTAPPSHPPCPPGATRAVGGRPKHSWGLCSNPSRSSFGSSPPKSRPCAVCRQAKPAHGRSSDVLPCALHSEVTRLCNPALSSAAVCPCAGLAVVFFLKPGASLFNHAYPPFLSHPPSNSARGAAGQVLWQVTSTGLHRQQGARAAVILRLLGSAATRPAATAAALF